MDVWLKFVFAHERWWWLWWWWWRVRSVWRWGVEVWRYGGVNEYSQRLALHVLQRSRPLEPSWQPHVFQTWHWQLACNLVRTSRMPLFLFLSLLFPQHLPSTASTFLAADPPPTVMGSGSEKSWVARGPGNWCHYPRLRPASSPLLSIAVPDSALNHTGTRHITGIMDVQLDNLKP